MGIVQYSLQMFYVLKSVYTILARVSLLNVSNFNERKVENPLQYGR